MQLEPHSGILSVAETPLYSDPMRPDTLKESNRSNLNVSRGESAGGAPEVAKEATREKEASASLVSYNSGKLSPSAAATAATAAARQSAKRTRELMLERIVIGAKRGRELWRAGDEGREASFREEEEEEL